MNWSQFAAVDLLKLRYRYSFAQLVQPQVGIMEGVTYLSPELGAPLFQIASTALGNLKMTFPYVGGGNSDSFGNQNLGGAGSDLDPELAWVRAVVEGAERYATIAWDPDDFVVASAAELGSEALDLSAIPRCSDREYADPKCPLRRTRVTEPMRWVRGYSLVSGRFKLVPAIMTHLYVKPWPSERFWLPISTGVAAHTHLAQALVSALCETIERDATALTWLARLPLRRIARPDPMPATVAPLFERLDESNVEQHFFDATTDLGVPTIFSVQISEGHPSCELFVSCATALDPMEACVKTIREAAPARNVMSIGRSIPEDTADFFDLTHGAVYYGRGDHRSDFDFLLKGDSVLSLDTMARDSLRGGSEERQLAFLVSRLRSRGWEAVAVDLTTDELRDVGLWVVRVVVPQAMPVSFVHRARYLGTPRLYEYPRRFGIEGLDEQRINPGPMPFA